MYKSGTLYAGISETIGTGKSSAMFLRMHCGTAKAGKREYEMSTNMGDGSPIIQSSQTGRSFTLNWEALIDMAVEAGIDDLKKPAKFAGEDE